MLRFLKKSRQHGSKWIDVSKGKFTHVKKKYLAFIVTHLIFSFNFLEMLYYPIKILRVELFK